MLSWPLKHIKSVRTILIVGLWLGMFFYASAQKAHPEELIFSFVDSINTVLKNTNQISNDECSLSIYLRHNMYTHRDWNAEQTNTSLRLNCSCNSVRQVRWTAKLWPFTLQLVTCVLKGSLLWGVSTSKFISPNSLLTNCSILSIDAIVSFTATNMRLRT